MFLNARWILDLDSICACLRWKFVTYCLDPCWCDINTQACSPLFMQYHHCFINLKKRVWRKFFFLVESKNSSRNLRNSLDIFNHYSANPWKLLKLSKSKLWFERIIRFDFWINVNVKRKKKTKRAFKREKSQAKSSVVTS